MAYKDFEVVKNLDVKKEYMNALKIAMNYRKENIKDLIQVKVNYKAIADDIGKTNDYIVFLYAWTKNHSYAMYNDRSKNICTSIPTIDCKS